MGIDYDAWLQKPYDKLAEDEALWEEAEEKFLKSDLYGEALDEWLSENEGKTEHDFLSSGDYDKWIESVIRDILNPVPWWYND